MPIARKHTYAWYYMDMWHRFSETCVLTQGSRADKISSKLLTRGLFVAYHDGYKFVSSCSWSRNHCNTCTTRDTELDLNFWKVGIYLYQIGGRHFYVWWYIYTKLAASPFSFCTEHRGRVNREGTKNANLFSFISILYLTLNLCLVYIYHSLTGIFHHVNTSSSSSTCVT